MVRALEDERSVRARYGPGRHEAQLGRQTTGTLSYCRFFGLE
jgi:hypothetical protein